ncbi:MAG: ChbG/HpnK family deacetylase [Candidatus Gottesmanbacteria bacterium]
MKKLIVNADDFGITKSVNEGIIHGFKNGIITSTSLMVNRPFADEAAQLAKENPKLGVGLHFEIIGDDNQVLRGIKKVTAYLSIGLFQVEKAKRLFYSQLKKFKESIGKMPTHIDGHYHVHKLPSIFPFISEFSNKYKIPYRMMKEINFIGEYSDYNHPENASIDYLTKILKGLPDKVSELMTHPGFSSDELRKISSMSDCRATELKTLTSSEIKKIIEEEKIQLINWSQIDIMI